MGDSRAASRGPILVVDDEPIVLRALSEILRRDGYEVFATGSPQQALAAAGKRDFAVVVADLMLPGMSGVELMQRLRDDQPETPFVVITGFATVESAVEVMTAGAFHYVAKPVRRAELLTVVERALEARRLREEVRHLRLAADRSTEFAGIVGASAAIRGVYAAIRKLAPTRTPVLIVGESGTGKELVARALHEASDRAQGPFVPVNCAAIPADVFESELFGHERGAFTGADRTRAGLFHSASGGTLLLDEIGELPPLLQPKLLRALQEGVVRKVGSDVPEPIHTRVLASTNVELRQRVEQGTFRDDLYYRLAVVTVRVPALRDRPEDIPLLAAHVLREIAPEQPLHLTPEAVRELAERRWPGNVRELENALRHAAVMAEGDEIRPVDLPPADDEPGGASVDQLVRIAAREGLTLRELDQRYIAAVASEAGSRSEAARRLGVHPRTLRRREQRER